jgi:hypothetical protein
MSIHIGKNSYTLFKEKGLNYVVKDESKEVGRLNLSKKSNYYVVEWIESRVKGLGTILVLEAFQIAHKSRLELTATQNAFFFFWGLGFRIKGKCSPLQLKEIEEEFRGKKNSAAYAGNEMTLSVQAKALWDKVKIKSLPLELNALIYLYSLD